MKVIIAGGRDFNDFDALEGEMRVLYWSGAPGLDGWDLDLEIVSGGARGADVLGERFALENMMEVKSFPANWDEHGKSAGYRRNAQMADYADVLVAFWDGMSRGTKHMIDLALDCSLEVHVYRY